MSVHEQQRSRIGRPAAGRAAPPPRAGDVRFEQNVVRDRPMILGFPAEYDEDDGPPAVDEPDGPGPGVRLVVARRPDVLAAVLLVLAGVAAGVSLWVPWLRGRDDVGVVMVSDGVAEAGAGMATLLGGPLWPVLAVVLGGGVLLLLGLLLLRPARTHRVVGVLELVVAGIATAGVVVLLAEAGWSPARFDLGAWCAVAVAGLGLVGALKAALTVPRVSLEREVT
ncbi:hypothetical protein ACI797_01810 [Geodermatophilus sp. SYSU D00691]